MLKLRKMYSYFLVKLTIEFFKFNIYWELQNSNRLSKGIGQGTNVFSSWVFFLFNYYL